MRYWAYTIGHADLAPPRDWLSPPPVGWDWHRTEMWFPRSKRPVSISARDRAIICGSRAKGFLAAVEITSETPEEPDHPREGYRGIEYPWVVKHRLLVSKACDENVASPESAGINTRRIQRGPHTELTPDEYERAVAVLVEAAQRAATT